MSRRLTDALLERLGISDSDGRLEVPGTRPDLAKEDREDDELWLGVAALAPLAAPPDGLFAAIEAEIDALPQAANETLRADDGEWIERSPKVWKKTLSRGDEDGRDMYLLRCEAGAEIPAHEHASQEYAFVIEGDIWVGDLLLSAGDFHKSRPGSTHVASQTTNGCLVLVWR